MQSETMRFREADIEKKRLRRSVVEKRGGFDFGVVGFGDHGVVADFADIGARRDVLHSRQHRIIAGAAQRVGEMLRRVVQRKTAMREADHAR